MLRSVGVLEGLFYNYVIVGEADADRAFYQEINERLPAAIPKIIEPLRKLGIPSRRHSRH
jgi:hypothetical protein